MSAELPPSSSGAPPPSDVSLLRAAPSPLYTPRQIACATLLATPVAGALLASRNLVAGGRPLASKVVVLLCTAAVAAVVSLDVIGYGALTLWMTPVWAALAWALASAEFAAGARRHGALPSVRVALVVAGVWLAFALIGGALAAWLHMRVPSAGEISGDAVYWSPAEVVHYERGATRDDAERVAKALAATRAFTGSGALKVSVDRAGAQLRFTVLAEPPVTPRDVEIMRKVSKHVAGHFDACIQGRVMSPGGLELARGTACP